MKSSRLCSWKNVRQKGEHRSKKSLLEVNTTGSSGTLGAAGALAGGVGMKGDSES